jgi:hypothetical protein
MTLDRKGYRQGQTLTDGGNDDEVLAHFGGAAVEQLAQEYRRGLTDGWVDSPEDVEGAAAPTSPPNI